jgi:hypothetical protein
MRQSKEQVMRLFLILVTIIISSAAYGKAIPSGDWWVDLDNETLVTEAFTSNQSGSSFGYLCLISTNSCAFYFSFQTKCNEGSSAPILLNTDIGSFTAQTKCTLLGSTNYNIIQDASSLSDAVFKSKNIGIAIPLEGGQFKVVRFSLNGANSAIRTAAERAEKYSKTSDQIL